MQQNFQLSSAEHEHELFAAGDADLFDYLLAVFECDERGYAHNSKALSNSGVIIDIELADLYPALHLLVKLLEYGCLHTTGSAPCRPEIDQDETGGCDGMVSDYPEFFIHCHQWRSI